MLNALQQVVDIFILLAKIYGVPFKTILVAWDIIIIDYNTILGGTLHYSYKNSVLQPIRKALKTSELTFPEFHFETEAKVDFPSACI